MVNYKFCHCAAGNPFEMCIRDSPNSALTGNLNIRVINEFSDVFVANAAAFPLTGRPISLDELLGCLLYTSRCV